MSSSLLKITGMLWRSPSWAGYSERNLLEWLQDSYLRVSHLSMLSLQTCISLANQVFYPVKRIAQKYAKMIKNTKNLLHIMYLIIIIILFPYCWITVSKKEKIHCLEERYSKLWHLGFMVGRREGRDLQDWQKPSRRLWNSVSWS